MGLTAGNVTYGIVEGCEIYQTRRDAINMSGAIFLSAINNTIDECADDAIAFHMDDSIQGAFEKACIVTGNSIRKSWGIQCLGIHNAVICGNNFRFFYGHAISVRRDPFYGQGDSARFGISICNNNLVDGLAPAEFDQDYPPYYNAINISGGGRSLGADPNDLPVLPGDYNPATGVFIKPEPSINQHGDLFPTTADCGVLIANNTTVQTLSGLTNFSDAGFGTLWSTFGSFDYATTGNIRALDFFVDDGPALWGLTIANNVVDGARAFVRMTDPDVMRSV
jgi:hypothetical protein